MYKMVKNGVITYEVFNCREGNEGMLFASKIGSVREMR